MHFLEAENPDRAALLLCSWIVGADPHSVERVEVGHFVGNRVLGHRIERAQDADDSGWLPAMNSKHVVDQD
jgi:hypothetical protein